MNYSILENVLKLVNFFNSISSPLVVFVIGSAVIIFSGYMFYSLIVRRDFGGKSISEKILFIFSIMYIIVFFVLGGDITKDLTPEEMGRAFISDLRSFTQQPEIINKYKDKILTSNYQDVFIKQLQRDQNELAGILNNTESKISMVECHYKHNQLSDYYYKEGEIPFFTDLDQMNEYYRINTAPENCRIVFRTTISKYESIKNDTEVEEYNVFFEILLTKGLIKSRFLGPYQRWKVSKFQYVKTEPIKYNLRDRTIEQIKKMDRILELMSDSPNI